MGTPESSIRSDLLKVLVLAAVLGAVALLTDEPAAVAGALATTVAARYHRRPASPCFGR